MELTLTLQGSTTVAVSCDEGPSHTFDLNRLLPAEKISGRPPQPLDDPLAYGQAVYQALFPPRSLATRLLDSELKRPDAPLEIKAGASQRRLLLVANGASLEAIPWEYARGPQGWLVCELPFVRGLPASERRPAPAVESGLHVVAVASNPLGKDISPLNIEGEWRRLEEVFRGLKQAAVLERVRPATLAELRRRLAGSRQRMVHFMGHGIPPTGEVALLFEKENGAMTTVGGRELVSRLGETTFLVVLNACASAEPSPTGLDSLAAVLMKQGVPYALGMRFEIEDSDALLLARTLYDKLGRGTPLEQAVWQVRLVLQGSRCEWLVGVPVLYTALQAPASGFTGGEGAAQVNDPQPSVDLYPLPRPAGGLQGRIDEQLWLGERLTGDQRARLLTILGVGGQGKSALAGVAAGRFAWAWPGGVYAATFENLPRREDFNRTLAQFLGIETQAQDPSQDPKGFRKPLGSGRPEELEKRLLDTLARQRTLLVLDNAETLVDGLDSTEAETAGRARALAGLLKRLLEVPTVTLLATALRPLGWPDEETLALEGLAPREGAHLFRQCAPQRAGKVYLKEAEALSRKLDGHPLSLRLLGAGFNESTLSLKEFILDYERQLLQAEDKIQEADARQRSLYTCLEISTRPLDADTRALLAGLCIFEAPFLAEIAVQVFDPDLPEGEHSAVRDRLQILERRSLLEKSERILRNGTVELYRLAAAVRLYASSYLKPALAPEELQARFARACAGLVSMIFNEMDRNTRWVYLAQQGATDLERGAAWLEKAQVGRYLTQWAWVVGRLGSPHRALDLFEQALPILRQVGDRAGEAVTLNNMGEVYRATDQPERALELYEQVLPIMREVGDRPGEAATLANLAFTLHRGLGRTAEAIPRVQQSIAIFKDYHLPQDSAGQSLADHEAFLAELQAALQPPVEQTSVLAAPPASPTDQPAPKAAVPVPPPVFPAPPHQPPAAHLTTKQLQMIASNTLVALTTAPNKLPQWRMALRSSYQQAQRANAQAEIELFAALLALLDQVPPALSADNPYAGLVQAIQQALAKAEPPEGSEDEADIPEELGQAVQALLQAQDLPDLRKVIEQHQKQLYTPEALELLDSLAKEANGSGARQDAQMLAFYVTLLQRCRQSGIPAVFEELAQSATPGALGGSQSAPKPEKPVTPPGAALPPDFVARCVAGLSGGKPEREAFFNYLAGVPVTDAGCAALLKDLKLWLLGSNPQKLGQKLEGPYAAAWLEIISQVL